MMHTLGITATLVVIVNAALVHRAWTSRWRPSRAVACLASRVQTLPHSLDDWTATYQAILPRELAISGAVATFPGLREVQRRDLPSRYSFPADCPTT
jgi:hypothetical protein